MRRRLLVPLFVLAACGGDGSSPTDGGGDDGGVDACLVPGCGEVDPCATTTCPDPRHLCVASGDTAECRCPAGTHAEADRCVDDVVCGDATCGPDGACDDSDGTVVCTCAAGYEGERCETCAEGWLRDAEGRCDDNLCEPSPCTDPDRTRCVVEADVARCLCNAGTHEEDGACVPDVVCSDVTCSGRGVCTDDAAGPTCECDEGFEGRFCDACDELAGYHADGAGGCTTDACLPDPCTAPPFRRCVASEAGVSCECPLGQHREGETCVVDEVCDASSCGGRGGCRVEDGRVVCTCDAGYEGDECERCAAGYHDDGEGGCTDSECLPTPCDLPNRGVCVETASGPRCDCDPGYHDDGSMGCTTNPCLPHPCGAQACRTGGDGAAECFTPVCDDGNPCTDDRPTMTGCAFVPLEDGSVCSTTACTRDQVCSAGTCGGGTAVVCDDVDPCTADTCDAVLGCRHVVDTARVPDDGVACTVDSCASGSATHVATDARCDDGRWCSGVERCAPTDAGADADGCVVGDVPVAPVSSTPCASYGACDEASRSFPLVTRPAGSACDDGIGCTTGDVCQSAGGACAGTVSGICSPVGSCASTTPAGDFVDVPTAVWQGRITLDGAVPPTTVPINAYGAASVWAVAQDTGVRHLVGVLRYTSSVTGGGYRRDANDDVIDLRLVPGVYDLLFDRDTSTSSSGSGDRWVGETASSSPLPSGWRMLRTGVVIGRGTNVVDVDVPTASVTGVITLDGATPPSTVPINGYGAGSVWAVSQDTGVRHLVGVLRYTSSVTGGGYRRDANDHLIDLRLVPGTYDLLFDRDTSTSSSGSGDRWVGETASSSPMPSGWRLIRSGVVIPAGASTLNVDIPTATVTGTITLDGATPPSTVPINGYGAGSVWAVSQDTGVRHLVGVLRYTSSVTGGGYRRDANDHLIDLRLVPGTYDLLFDRDTSTSSSGSGDRWVGETASSSPMPSGWRLIRSGVVIPAGASTLNVDIPTASVTGTITLDGATPPSTVPINGYGAGSVWAVSQDTGVRHLVGVLRYTSSVTGGGYRRDANDHLIDLRLVPGTYDLLFDRDTSTSSSGSGDRWVGETASSSPMPSGWRLIRSGVVIPAGASTLNVDIPTASVTGTISLDGATPPSTVPTNGYGAGSVWAVSQDTGVRHLVGVLRYTSSVTGGGYRRDANDHLIDLRLVPGTYDLLFDRDTSTSSSGSGDRWVGETASSSPMPSGWRYLRRGVVVPAGASTLNVDVPTLAWLGEIGLDGAEPPRTVPINGYGAGSVWAVSRDTNVRHLVGVLRYTSSVTGGGYRRDANDHVIDLRLVPGTYDLLFDRDTSTSSSGSGDRWVGETASSSPMPSGWRYLRQCVLVE
ncbi:MAG: hypothetical protein H6722_33235 [Sandaracinus sp.]|nr:hypothetical protein [Sandaracinus sp.]